MTMQTKETTFEATVQSWGKDLGLRITRPIRDLSHLHKGDKVMIVVTEEGLLVRPKTNQPPPIKLTEAELISNLTPELAHADELPDLLEHEYSRQASK